MYFFEFQLNEHDYISFYTEYSKYYKYAERGYAILKVLFPLGLFIVFYTDVMEMSHPIVSFATFVLIPSILWFAYFEKIIIQIECARVKKLLDDGYYHTVLIEVLNEGVYSKTQSTDNFINWNNVDSIIDGKDHLYLFVSDTQALIIPYRIFDSREYKNEVLQFIHRKLVYIPN